ncbi:MAG: inorganic phosphate transporter, partial [Gammaproteobacteria bacterium]|nr:inorganic phosphate transporter [Gammaproteobacteria bacterium]
STRMMKPFWAVMWAAFFNFIAFLFFGVAVAKTVGAGIIDKDIITLSVIFGALMGAIIWNLLTWWWGMPSSSSHALVGGLIGAGIAKAGGGSVVWDGTMKTVAGIVLSPTVGMVLAMLMMLAISWMFRRVAVTTADKVFRPLQFVASSLYSLGHGANDAQKTMGIIAVLLYSQGLLEGADGANGDKLPIPLWVVISCQAAMGLGTMIGGWRIVKTMGSKITKLSMSQGFAAQTSGAIALFLATNYGVPVSTTQTIAGSITGVGIARGASAVRWSVARDIFVTWIVTIPAAATMGALFYGLASALGI